MFMESFSFYQGWWRTRSVCTKSLHRWRRWLGRRMRRKGIPQ